MVMTMNTRSPLRFGLALVSLLVALALPASAMAEQAVKYTSESVQTFEQQLKAGEIASVTFNRYDRHMLITLKNGDHVYVHYEAHGDQKLESQLKAASVSYTVLQPAQAEKEAKESAGEGGHTIRWLALGAVVVIALAVGVYFATRRNRNAE